MTAFKPRARLNAPIGETLPNGLDAVEVEGRIAWAISVLHEAGSRGVSRLEHASTSLPCYVYKLRHKYGLAIHKVMEEHDGKYAGTHARYFLETPLTVTPLTPDETKPATAATVRASNPNCPNRQAGGKLNE